MTVFAGLLLVLYDLEAFMALLAVLELAVLGVYLVEALLDRFVIREGALVF